MSSSSSSGSSAVKSSDSPRVCWCCQYGTMPETVQVVFNDMHSYYFAILDQWFPDGLCRCCEDLDGWGTTCEFMYQLHPGDNTECGWHWQGEHAGSWAEWQAGGDWGPCGLYYVFVNLRCRPLSWGGDGAGEVYVYVGSSGTTWCNGGFTWIRNNYRSDPIMLDFDIYNPGEFPGSTENRLDCSSIGSVNLYRDPENPGQGCYREDYEFPSLDYGTSATVTF